MPFISTKVNVKITKEKEEALKSGLGKAIEQIPGKSEHWLMLSFEDECRLWFQGNNQESIALVEVKVFGKATAESYEKATAAITDLLHTELDIKPSNIYVKYEEVAYWGWNGSNL